MRNHLHCCYLKPNRAQRRSKGDVLKRDTSGTITAGSWSTIGARVRSLLSIRCNQVKGLADVDVDANPL